MRTPPETFPALATYRLGLPRSTVDLQNTHATIWSPWGNPQHRGHYLDRLTPEEYQNGVKYGSPSGLMQILR